MTSLSHLLYPLYLYLYLQDCPFIVCMTYAFHTPDKLCFILDLMNGKGSHHLFSLKACLCQFQHIRGIFFILKLFSLMPKPKRLKGVAHRTRSAVSHSGCCSKSCRPSNIVFNYITFHLSEQRTAKNPVKFVDAL